MSRLHTIAGVLILALITIIFAQGAALDPIPRSTPEPTEAPSDVELIIIMQPSAPMPLSTLPPPSAEEQIGQDDTPDETPPKTTDNGIAEGDVIIGELTHYDVCMKCCSKLDGITASGLVIQNGVKPEIPVASCNWLPLGTLVEIKNVLHIVADRGGKGLDTVGRFDIFTPAGHDAALRLGRKRDVEIKVVSLP